MGEQGWDTIYHQHIELQAKEHDLQQELNNFINLSLEELQVALEELETAYIESPSVTTDLEMAKYKKRIKELN